MKGGNFISVLGVLCLLAVFIIFQIGGCSENNSDNNDFPQPEARQSQNGALRTTIDIAIATNQVQDPSTGEIRTIHSPTYEGALTGPTLRVKPGDTIFIDMINNLPLNPPQERMGAYPHNPFTTNFHTHGLTVDPGGISDNVLRKMQPGGTVNPIEVVIPPDHQSGTFWYHPHKHGSVSFQFFGGMSGFLIIEGGPGTLDAVPEVKAAKEILMAFQVIRTDQDGQLPFVNPNGEQFSSIPGTTTGLWSTYQNSNFYLTTNGVTNPVLHMRPGEVQRWRMLNAGSGKTLAVALQNHNLNIVANDGITVLEMVTLDEGEPYIMGAGNRVDVMIKAGEPGTYLLQVLNPSTPRSVIAGTDIDPRVRDARIGFDFPFIESESTVQDVTYPYTLAIVVVSGNPKEMNLPEGPLPVPEVLPSVETMLSTPLDAKRNVSFEICGQRFFMERPDQQLPSCGWFFNRYDAEYWGGTEFTSLLMMRDADDTGNPSLPFNPLMPLVDFQKEGLFTDGAPLYDDMLAGNFEEWTIWNKSFSDHPFHIHINPFLVTHVNGVPLEVPEWRDTMIIPGAEPQPNGNNPDSLPITSPDVIFGSVTFRTYFDPDITGTAVMHCHILTHEDVGMMQEIEIKEP